MLFKHEALTKSRKTIQTTEYYFLNDNPCRFFTRHLKYIPNICVICIRFIYFFLIFRNRLFKHDDVIVICFVFRVFRNEI